MHNLHFSHKNHIRKYICNNMCKKFSIRKMISYELIEIIVLTINQSYYFILRYFYDVKKIIDSIDCN